MQLGVQIGEQALEVAICVGLVLERGHQRLGEHLTPRVLRLKLEREQREMRVDGDVVEADLVGRSLVCPERERVQHSSADAAEQDDPV